MRLLFRYLQIQFFHPFYLHKSQLLFCVATWSLMILQHWKKNSTKLYMLPKYPLIMVHFQATSSSQNQELCFWSAQAIPDFQSQTSERLCRKAQSYSKTPPEESGCLEQFFSFPVQGIQKYLLKTCTRTSALGKDHLHNEVPMHRRTLLNAFPVSCH